MFLRFLCPVLLCASSPAHSQTTLREAAGEKLLLGCAVATRDFTDPKLSALVAEQFNCLTPEEEFMPEKLIDEHGKFTFEAADKLLHFAEDRYMPVFGWS